MLSKEITIPDVIVIVASLTTVILGMTLLFFQIDSLQARKESSDQREDLMQQNFTIERQNKYKICLLEGIWRTVPEQRTETQLQKCKKDNL